jgi:hypothetical protein
MTVATESSKAVNKFIDIESLPALPKKLDSKHIGKTFRANLEDIVKSFNIRLEKNTNNVSDIAENIAANGFNNYLIINLNKLLCDGNRRYKVAETLKLTQLPVIVQNIPEDELPLYQFNTAQRKNFSPVEISRGITEYHKRNPEVSLRSLGTLFGVTHITALKATVLHRVSPTLSDLVSNGYLSQNAALSIVDANIKDTGNITNLEQRKVADVIEQVLPSIEADWQEKQEKGEEFKSWDLKKINSILAENKINRKKEVTATEEGEDKKLSDSKLLRALVNNIAKSDIEELADGSFAVPFILSKEVLEALLKLTTATKEKRKINYVEAIYDETNGENVISLLRDLTQTQTGSEAFILAAEVKNRLVTLSENVPSQLIVNPSEIKELAFVTATNLKKLLNDFEVIVVKNVKPAKDDSGLIEQSESNVIDFDADIASLPPLDIAYTVDDEDETETEPEEDLTLGTDTDVDDLTLGTDTDVDDLFEDTEETFFSDDEEDEDEYFE